MASAALHWTKIEGTDRPHYLEDDDYCLHCREYAVGEGWSGETNDLIGNFKRDVSYRGKSPWKYKQRAIAKFADELAIPLAAPHRFVVVPIPTSKRRDDPLHDSRLTDVVQLLMSRQKNISIEHPIDFIESHSPHHKSEDKRHPNIVYRMLEWIGFSGTCSNVVLLDDVISSGSHFKACKRLIQKHHPTLPVYGLFWARSVRQGAAVAAS